MTRADRPTLEQIERELIRREGISRYRRVLRITLAVLAVVVALSVLTATLWFPILRVSGASMSPALEADDVVMVVKARRFECGEIVAFYYNNKILLKRAIAGAGDWVDMDADGNVFVNDVKLDEPYAVDKGEGLCDLTFPFQVPEDSWFMLGDHRSTSVDSRSSQVGCIKSEDVLGKVFLRIYPFGRVRFVS